MRSPRSLSASDLRAVLDAADRCAAARTATGVTELLDALAVVVPSDIVFWNSFTLEPPSRRGLDLSPAPTRPPGPITHEGILISARGREVTRAPLEPWRDHLAEHPIMSGRFGPVTAISDVLSTRAFRDTWLFQEAFRPVGLAREIGLELTHRQDEMSVIVFSRAPGPDFTARDHLVLELLRPHVDSAIRRLSAPSPALTPRQQEVMRLVGEGLTDTQVAHRLRLSERTVGKHLEHIYARTGAHSRLQAVALSGLSLA